MTCVADSSAAKIADSVIAYRKLFNFCYNTSTYWNDTECHNDNKLLKTFKENLPRRFKKYSSYSFVLPDEYGAIAPMLDIKRHDYLIFKCRSVLF